MLLITNQLLKDFLSYVDMFLSFRKSIYFLQHTQCNLSWRNSHFALKKTNPLCPTAECTSSCWDEIKLFGKVLSEYLILNS